MRSHERVLEIAGDHPNAVGDRHVLSTADTWPNVTADPGLWDVKEWEGKLLWSPVLPRISVRSNDRSCVRRCSFLGTIRAVGRDTC